ncbi:MAG: hypothetical protein RI580_09225, partial [Halothece sp. Uz-M2-17]|nr:hypothetical protein [Halothece sp. Uz-M2-17]
TTLISPGLLVIALILGNWIIAGIIACWLILTRCLYLLMVFWGRPSILKLVHLPVMLFTQWWTALIKIFTRMNLSQQKWTNRHGNKKGSKNKLTWGQQVQKKSSQFLLYTQMCSFIIFLCWQWGMIQIGQDLPSWWKTRQLIAQPIPTTVVQAIDYGIVPNDGKDDAKALQTLINNLPQTGVVEVRLPIGEIELFQPLEINRSQTLIVGEGTQGTILHSYLKPPVSTVLKIQPKSSQDSLIGIELRDFAIKAAHSDFNQLASSIHIEELQKGILRNLSLQVGQKSALTLVETNNMRVEYVATGI